MMFWKESKQNGRKKAKDSQRCCARHEASLFRWLMADD
jgi:hypothetical protein